MTITEHGANSRWQDDQGAFSKKGGVSPLLGLGRVDFLPHPAQGFNDPLCELGRLCKVDLTQRSISASTSPACSSNVIMWLATGVFPAQVLLGC